MNKQYSEDEQKYKPRVLKDLLGHKVINGKYTIGSLIQTGPFTEIFFAVDPEGQKFAVKAIDLAKVEATNNSKIVEMIDYEHKAMTVCHNPHLMKCIDVYVWTEQKVKLIVMEYCEFGSLSNLIYIRSRFTELEAKIVLKQILHGLADFNRHGLIHRDCKSENICFRGLEAVVCDFGCSKVFLDQNQRQRWRNTHKKPATVAGTNHTKSPQMLKGESYGMKTDIWGIGLIFYQMLTGVSPFYYDDLLGSEQLLKNIERDLNSFAHDLHKEGINRRKQQCRIPEKEEKFLRQILVYDQAQRINWQKLIQHQYLNEQTDIDTSRCIFPFKDLNWSEIKKQFEREIEEHPTVPQVIKITSVEPISDNKERQKVYKIQNESYARFKNFLRINQEIYFYRREMELLMEARKQLCQIQMTQKVKFSLIISRYCRKRLIFIQKKYKEETKQLNFDFLSQYQINESIECLAQVIEADYDALLGTQQGIFTSTMISALSFFRSSNTQAEVLSKQLTLQRVVEIINEKSARYWNRFDEKIQIQIKHKYPQLYTLLNQSKFIVGMSYSIDQKQWTTMIENRVPPPEWSSLSSISSYFKTNIKSK